MVLGKGELSTENAAFRLRDSIFKSINQKMHVRGDFVIWQRLFMAEIMKFC
jgi:hypothetical protein